MNMFRLSLLALAVMALTGCEDTVKLCQENFTAGKYDEAYKYCSKAEQDDKSMDSRYYKAVMDVDALVPSADFEKGISSLNVLSCKDYLPAVIKLMKIYGEGTAKVEKNPERAFPFVEKAAKMGNSEAVLRYALMKFVGIGTAKKARDALPYLEKEANKGNEKASLLLADYWLNYADKEKSPVKALQYLEPLVKKGNEEALYKAGLAYQMDSDVQDEKKARELILKSAELGYHNAEIVMLNYANRDIIALKSPENIANLRRWIRVNAEKGESNAQNLLGLDLITGFIGPLKDGYQLNEEEGVMWLTRSVDSGNRNGMLYLTDYYLSKNSKETFRKAVYLLRNVTLKGNVIAQRKLGDIMMQGRIVGEDEDPKENLDAGMRLLMNAAEAGEVGALERVGALLITGYYFDKDVEQAVKFLEEAAEKGSVNAPLMLFEVYRDGIAPFKKDNGKAVSYLYNAADAKNSKAEALLASLKDEGSYGVSQDLNSAKELYKSACQKGVSYACHNLASLYYTGRGGKKDLYEAYKYWVYASKQGYAQAINSLGHMYAEGETPNNSSKEENMKLAAKLYQIAAEKGEPQAMENLGRFLQMTKRYKEAYFWFSAEASCGLKNGKGLARKNLYLIRRAERQQVKNELPEFLNTYGCKTVEDSKKSWISEKGAMEIDYSKDPFDINGD